MFEITQQDIESKRFILESNFIYELIKEIAVELDPDQQVMIDSLFIQNSKKFLDQYYSYFRQKQAMNANQDQRQIQILQTKREFFNVLFNQFANLLGSIDGRLQIIFENLQTVNTDLSQQTNLVQNGNSQSYQQNDKKTIQEQIQKKLSELEFIQKQFTFKPQQFEDINKNHQNINIKHINEQQNGRHSSSKKDSSDLSNNLVNSPLNQQPIMTQQENDLPRFSQNFVKENQSHRQTLQEQNPLQKKIIFSDKTYQNQTESDENENDKKEDQLNKLKQQINQKQNQYQHVFSDHVQQYFGRKNSIQEPQYIETSKNIGPVKAKSMTPKNIISLKQLKSQISEIIKSKQLYDQRQQEYNVIQETMEQHLYTFLNKKYGLKSIVIEHANQIVQAIQYYSQEDCEVKIFGKILCNECDEDFYKVIGQVAKNINQILKLHISQKMPQKTDAFINKKVSEIITSKIHIDDCGEILSTMYEQEVNIIQQDFKQLYNQILNQIKDDDYIIITNRIVPRIERISNEFEVQKQKQFISFDLFSQTILNFVFKQHMKFLENFILLFRQFDKNQDGIMTEKEFTSFLQNFGFNEQYIEKYLMILDTLNQGQIVFTKCIKLFAQQQVPIANKKITILQYISQLNQ